MDASYSLPPEPPLAVGRTAKVYAWGEQQVLKLFAADYPAAEIDHEAEIGRIVAEAGVDAPAVGGFIAIGNQRGILYRRINGVSLLDALMRRPWQVGKLARTFGRMHAAMHLVLRPQLPSQRARLLWAINHAGALTPAQREAVAARLNHLDDGDAVCHGDYHPDNIILSAGGPVIIDWLTAGHGNPDADVARTVLLLRLGEPVNRSAIERSVIMLMRRLFLNGYLRGYRSRRACPPHAVAAWLPIVAAARIAEGIGSETDRLVAFATGA